MQRRDTALTVGAAACSHCGSDDRWTLHHVHFRNIFRRLCTTCVLKLNIASFCPICFALHDRPNKPPTTLAVAPAAPLLRGTLICFKCNSSSHTSCVAPNAPKSPYLCPTCSNPNAKLFDFKIPSKSAFRQVIDLRSAKVFLAAATIAANSLNEAADRARAEAERKAKETVAARKKAKDALEQVALIWESRDEDRIRMGEAPIEATPVSVGNNGLGAGLKAHSRSAFVQVEKNGGAGGSGVSKEVEKTPSGRQLIAGLNNLVDKIKIEKAGANSGGQGDKSKVNNGLMSASQPLQKVTNLDNHGGKVN